MREAEADPTRTQDGCRNRDGRGLPGLADPMQHECEHEGRQEPSRSPLEAAELRPEQREQRARVCRKCHGAQRPRHERVLVQSEHRRDRREREQPPPARIDDGKHDREADRSDQNARQQRAHRPPKRRLRLA